MQVPYKYHKISFDPGWKLKVVVWPVGWLVGWLVSQSNKSSTPIISLLHFSLSFIHSFSPLIHPASLYTCKSLPFLPFLPFPTYTTNNNIHMDMRKKRLQVQPTTVLNTFSPSQKRRKKAISTPSRAEKKLMKKIDQTYPCPCHVHPHPGGGAQTIGILEFRPGLARSWRLWRLWSKNVPIYRKRKEKKEYGENVVCPKCKVPLSLYMRSTWYSSNIPEGWIGTLGLGEEKSLENTMPRVTVFPRANQFLACGPCGLMEVGQK